MATRAAPKAAAARVTTAMGAPRVPGFPASEPKAPPNAFKQARQDAKVAYIVLAAEDFSKHTGTPLHELIPSMERWTQGQWDQLALAGGQRPPSDESKARVLTRLRARASQPTVAPPAYVTKYAVVYRDADRLAQKHELGLYATEAEANEVADRRRALEITSGSGFREDVWVESRQVRP